MGHYAKSIHFMESKKKLRKLEDTLRKKIEVKKYKNNF